MIGARRALLAGALLLGAPQPSSAQQQSADAGLVPRPRLVEARPGRFVLTARSSIATDPMLSAVADRAASEWRLHTGFPLPIGAPRPGASAIVLTHDTSVAEAEGYRLDLTSTRATIRARTEAGAFYGLVTLQQLFPPTLLRAGTPRQAEWRARAVHIVDAPRFSWRGSHLDVARHFMPVADVKRYIDALARHKLNRFHWHLTDDQGWRLQIRKYPKLAEVGGCRAQTLVGRYEADPAKRVFDGTPHCGFYTQDEVRDVVQYAAERFITVVPEIEMPGHAQAAVAAYPALGVQPDSLVQPLEIWGVSPVLFNAESGTIAVLHDVLDEVLALFPSPWIHIGGDEAEKTLWKATPRIQARMRELGLRDEHELQSWFVRQMDRYLVDRGRRMIGWDEILEGGLAEHATVMSWRGTAGGEAAARAGHEVVMTPTSHTYFDYLQSKSPTEPLSIGGFLPLEQVYAFEPVPTSLTAVEATRVLGTQGQLWTEYLPSLSAVEYMAFPRLSALAEVSWSPRSARNFRRFRARLTVHLQRLDALGIRYRPLDP